MPQKPLVSCPFFFYFHFCYRCLQAKALCSARPVRRTSCSKTACAPSARGPSTTIRPRNCANRATRRVARAPARARSAVRRARSRCTWTGRTRSACPVADRGRTTTAAPATRTPASVTTRRRPRNAGRPRTTKWTPWPRPPRSVTIRWSYRRRRRHPAALLSQTSHFSVTWRWPRSVPFWSFCPCLW